MTVQPQNNNWNYSMDPTFTNFNRLFILSFERNIVGDNRDSWDTKRWETYKKIIDMSNNKDYTTGNLLDFAYFNKSCKLISIDLSKQTKLKDPQQISFIGKLLNRHWATVFLIIKKSGETTSNFSQNFVTII